MRERIAIGAAVVVGLVTGLASYLDQHSWLYAAGAFGAGMIAVALVWFVTTLPGLTVRGLVIGGFFVLAGMVSWTSLGFTNHLVWPLLAAEGLVFAWWSRPWVRDLGLLPKLGSAWLGLAYWYLGVLGALFALQLKVGAGRVVYAGLFTLAVLAVLASNRRRGAKDLSVGVAGAFLLGMALLTLSGSGNLFQHNHVVPAGVWGVHMNHRFWGGPWLLYHPNSLGLIAVVVALRIGVDRAFAVWQRLAVTVLAGAVILVTDSRTSFGYLAVAGVVHAFLLLRRRGTGLPEYRRVWLAAATPFAVLALVLAITHGSGFLFQERYAAGDMTSGRTDTWKKVGQDWLDHGVDYKLFGDYRNVRASVHRANDGHKAGQKPVDLSTDNAAVGALQRGGALGELAFLFGLGLLLVHAWRGARRDTGRVDPAPAWLTVTAIGAVPTIATADWILGGTGGTLWILLVAGEAWLRQHPADDPGPAATPTGEVASVSL